MYQKGGSIIPRKMRIRRSSALMVHDPFTLIACLDAEVGYHIFLVHCLKYDLLDKTIVVYSNH